MELKQLNVLLADDDIDDCNFFKKALKELPLPTDLVTVHDGEALMTLLNKEVHSLPHVIFLDINMPVLSGWDVLNSFKNFTEITKEQFIIYILSSSIASEDKERAANSPLVTGYIEKPLSLGLIQAILNGSN